jgi:ubiquinone/menaquinone biosynthesis C-methylase UbiE
MPAPDATTRFSTRVDNYVRYRPAYPTEVIKLLHDECGLKPDHVIADVASGTGIFTRLLLDNGNPVFAIEPNAEMRIAGQQFLENSPRLTSIAGKAENTTLPTHSVDFVTAAQAAHWFDRVAARREFVRILKPGGWCALIWNERRTSSTPFLRDYEQLLLSYGTDYENVRHERTTETLPEFFAPNSCAEQNFDYQQEFQYESLEGRLLSSSYAPLADHPKHSPMLKELRRIYDLHQSAGRVAFEYHTRVFYGHLT